LTLYGSRSTARIITPSLRSQKENVAKVVGATSSEGSLVHYLNGYMHSFRQWELYFAQSCHPFWFVLRILLSRQKLQINTWSLSTKFLWLICVKTRVRYPMKHENEACDELIIKRCTNKAYLCLLHTRGSAIAERRARPAMSSQRQ